MGSTLGSRLVPSFALYSESLIGSDRPPEGPLNWDYFRTHQGAHFMTHQELHFRTHQNAHLRTHQWGSFEDHESAHLRTPQWGSFQYPLSDSFQDPSKCLYYRMRGLLPSSPRSSPKNGSCALAQLIDR